MFWNIFTRSCSWEYEKVRDTYLKNLGLYM